MSRRRESETPSTRCSAHPTAVGWAPSPRPTGTVASPAAAMRRAPSGICCSRCSTPCRAAPAGSAPARSTTSASGSRSRPPRPTAWPRSTRCSRSSRSRRPWRTSAPTSPAWRAGRSELCADLEARIGPKGGQHGSNGAGPGEDPIWLESPCLGMCEMAPVAMVSIAGEEPHEVSVGHAEADGIAALLAGGDAARAGRPEGAAGRGPRAAAPAPRRPRRPDERRQLSRARRLRGPARRAGDGRAGRAARGQRLQAARARRRRVPDRPQVGGRGGPPDPPALPDLQRRRVRARDVQGPRAPRARPVLRHRVDDDRGLRHRLRARLPLPARRVPAGLGAPGRRRHRGAGARLPRPGHLRPRHQLRHRAAQGRGRVHLRRGDGALQLDRGLPRRAAQQAAVPRRARAVRQADGDQQRRDAGQRPRHRPRRRPGLRARSAPRTRRARACSASRVGSRGPGCTRCRSASPSARCSTWPAA